MKKLLMLMFFCTPANATLVGHIDLGHAPAESCALRDLNTGENMGGACLPVWHLARLATVSGTSVEDGSINLGIFEAWTFSHGAPTFGSTAWIKLGKVGDRLERVLTSVGSETKNFSWLKTAGDFVSLGAFFGATPLEHWRLAYGFGGKISIPLAAKK